MTSGPRCIGPLVACRSHTPRFGGPTTCIFIRKFRNQYTSKQILQRKHTSTRSWASAAGVEGYTAHPEPSVDALILTYLFPRHSSSWNVYGYVCVQIACPCRYRCGYTHTQTHRNTHTRARTHARAHTMTHRHIDTESQTRRRMETRRHIDI